MDEKSDNNISIEGTVNTKRPLFKSVRNYFREYCNCSSIHGFRYFGEKRTYFERGWWFIVFGITLGICVFFIREVYLKWERSPVIVSFATTETPIYQIPFPAVTICPESKTNQSLFNHTDILRKLAMKKNVTDDDRKLFGYMNLICSRYPNVDLNGDEIFENDFYDALKNVSLNYHSVFSECKYLGTSHKCSKLFQPILTDEGLCFTFNMLDRSEIYKPNVLKINGFHTTSYRTNNNWTMENGYSEKAGVNAYPRRALLSGTKNALTLTLISFKSNIDYTCKSSLQGFRVMLHAPMRVPLFSQQYFRVPLNQQVVAAIQPNMITTSDSVKMYNPLRRKCYFPSERSLRYFQNYTSLNCKLECLTNYTLHECGCVSYYMPRDNDTYLCGSASIDCMREAERRLQMGILYTSILKPHPKKSKKKLKACDCMPICTDVSYDVETSQTDWQWQKWMKAWSHTGELPFADDDVNLSKLTLFFKSTQFITSQRHELYGPTDFLANFGGLLGLFTGFSILSLMEIFYFLSVRLICNTRLYGYWAGPET